MSKNSTMVKKETIRSWFRKHGKKALVVYICWSVLKGLVFLFLGYKLFS